MGRQALHWVFKVADRQETIRFLTKVIGMKVLRHEEFEEGCQATCNGPYDNKWSKTMVGFGPEDDHFVAELTYNYTIGSYRLGNDFLGLTIESSKALDNVGKEGWPHEVGEGDRVELEAPGGYKFNLKQGEGKVTACSISSSNLTRSLKYWRDVLGMTVFKEEEKTVSLGYGSDQCKLEIVDRGQEIDHAKAFGRIAFSCPARELPEIEAKAKEAGEKVLTPLLSLDTPGKATVQVVVLADPDGYEICFVGDEAFRELSRFDPKAEELLNKV